MGVDEVAEHQEASQRDGASVEGRWVEEEASLEFLRVVVGAWSQWEDGRSSEEVGA